MEKTKIWVVKRYFSILRGADSMCFFLSKEEAEYYISKLENEITYFYCVEEVIAGDLIKDKDFEKFKQKQKQQEIENLKQELEKLKKCEIKDKQKQEEIEIKINNLLNK